MRVFNPASDEEPSNERKAQLKQTYDALEDEGVDGTELAALRNTERDLGHRLAVANRLREEHLTPDTLEQQVESELEDATLSEGEREEVEQLLARAETMDGINPDQAESLREQALTFAEYGEPESYSAALSSTRVDRIERLEGRAQSVGTTNPDHAADLREQAVDVAADALTDQRLVEGDEAAVRRDAEATVEQINAEAKSR